MPYTPKLMCLRPADPTGSPDDAHAFPPTGASPLPEKAVIAVTAVTEMRLSEFAAQQVGVRATVDWSPEPIWFVPAERHARVLVRQGIGRGRIWTVAELQQIVDLDTITDDQLRNLARIKAMFGCTVLEAGADVAPPRLGPTDKPTAAPPHPRLPFAGDQL